MKTEKKDPHLSADFIQGIYNHRPETVFLRYTALQLFLVTLHDNCTVTPHVESFVRLY